MKTCLVVDDTGTVGKVVAHMMIDLGYRCVVAGSGDEAAVVCSGRTHPDLLLVDSGMPEMEGYRLLERLRSCQSGSFPKVLAMLPPQSDADAKARALDAGVDGVLVKPFDRLALAAKVEEVDGPGVRFGR